MLSIIAGDEIVFEIDNRKAVLKTKSTSIETLKKYVGFLAHLKGKKSDYIIDELRGKADDPGR